MKWLTVLVIVFFSLSSFAQTLKTHAVYKQYENREWRVDIEVDDEQGNRYHQAFYSKTEPDSEKIYRWVNKFINELKRELQLAKNPLNKSESFKDEYKKSIIILVKAIRKNPQITASELKELYYKEFPGSVFNFEALLKIAKEKAKAKDFAELKERCINEKFTGVDY